MNSALLAHLSELRTRLIRVLIVLSVLFILLFCFDHQLYAYLTEPLLQEHTAGYLIATQVTSPFTVPMKVAGLSAVLLAMPYVLYELWSFIAPALHALEKRTLCHWVLSSTLLFYLGLGFAFWMIAPMAFQFFAQCAPPGLRVMTDIESYLDFLLTLLLGGGLAFQVPVITVALLQSGLCSKAQLQHLRPYVIVGAFVLGMFLSPPDVISQILLALPMWGLFELGLLYPMAYKK